MKPKKVKKNRKQLRKEKKEKWQYKFNKEISNLFNMFDTSNTNAIPELNNSWFSANMTNNINHTNVNFNYTHDKTPNKILRSYKVKINPNPFQVHVLQKWFLINRLVYNLAVKIVNNKTDANTCNFRKLRELLKNSIKGNSYLFNLCKKYKFPSHSIDYMAKRVTSSLKTCMTNLKRGNIHYFRIRPVKENKAKQTMVLEGSAFSSKLNTFCPSIFNEFKTNKNIKGIKINCNLTYDKNKNTYTLFVPYEIKHTEDKKKDEIISIDPGMRTFMTGYTLDNVLNIGNNNKYIEEKLNKIHKLDELRRKHKSKLLKKQYFMVQQKLENAVDDLHWKTCKYLCENYKVIVIGKMSTKSITKRKDLSTRVKELLLYQRHYVFRQRLKAKCEEYKVKLIEVNEHQTSLTCGICGEHNKTLGSSKIFNCKKCNLKIDRDLNGARNILIKCITDEKLLLK